MNKLFQIALVACAATAAMPASATEFTFDLRNDGIGTPAVAWGNSFKYQVKVGTETLDLMVSGWSRQLDNSIKTGAVASWDPNGLGIYQQGESGEGALHQVDNVNGWEFLSLQFSKNVTLTSGVFNVYVLAQTDSNGNPVKDRWGNIAYRDYVDNDAFIGWGNSSVAWNANLGLNNFGQQTVFDALSGSINTNSDGTAYQKIDVSGATGNTWLIGGSINGPDWRNDAFKLAGVTVRTVTGSGGSGVVSPVPEPATWAMMLVGFGMVGAASRYRRRKTVTVYA